MERPDVLFATARREGLETALDWECWRAALRGALAGGLSAERALFVNVEPSSATSWVPEIGDPLLEEVLERFPLVVELTERALPNHATDLIPLAEDLRRRGARIALDDVGTDPRSLALMPFLRPDVIKLDLKLMHNSPSREIAEVAQAVNAEAERTGALILAEGIETEEHLQRALALGATYGQGWLFGRPSDLPAEPDPRDAIFPLRRNAATMLPAERTPFEIVAAKRQPRRADNRLLIEDLRGEWDVIVLDPHFGAAFVARDLGDTGSDRERRFDFALTHDRDLVTEAARAMMRRLAG